MAELDELAEGDHVLFGDRTQPLRVTDVGEERVLVEGPHGGDYMLFRAEDSGRLLVAKPGNREYASYAGELRVVGHWERVADDRWEHTGTGASIALERTEAGFWSLAVEGLDDVEVPKYGFTEKDIARQEAEKLMRDEPEG